MKAVNHLYNVLNVLFAIIGYLIARISDHIFHLLFLSEPFVFLISFQFLIYFSLRRLFVLRLFHMNENRADQVSLILKNALISFYRISGISKYTIQSPHESNIQAL